MATNFTRPANSETAAFTTDTRICLLGFSGSILSLIFSTLAALEFKGDVAILENLKLDDSVPFDAGIPYQRHWYEDFPHGPKDVYLFSMMRPSIKKQVFEFFLAASGVSKNRYTNLLHPSVIVGSQVSLDKGIYVEPGCIISPHARIEFGVSINRASSIGHHTMVGEFAMINPGVHISGHCAIGKGVTVGVGSSVFDHVSIGDNSIIGGGSVVNKDIPPGVMAYGNPCRVVKKIA